MKMLQGVNYCVSTISLNIPFGLLRQHISQSGITGVRVFDKFDLSLTYARILELNINCT